MELATVLSGLAVVAAIGFPLLARRDLLTKLEERDRTREQLWKDINKKVETLYEGRQNTEFAAMVAMDKERERAWWEWRREVDRKHDDYKDWKHESADPYILNYKDLERRVARIERVLNGKISPQ